MSTKLKIQYCPYCSKKLVNIVGTDGVSEVSVCTRVECRTVIQGNKVARMTLESFSRISEEIIEEQQEISGYMLLNEKGTGPLFVKNSNSHLEKNRDTYCIIKAKSHSEAVQKLKDKYTYIKVKEDMVIPVNIKEVQ